MKKLSIFAIAALSLVAAACSQEKPIVPSDAGVATITATHAQATRSALSGDNVILWDAPDKILAGYVGAVAEFTSTNTAPAENATFKGKLPEGSGSLYGIYPAASGNSVPSEGTFSIAFKAEQQAVAGSYDPKAFPAVAVSESNDLSFQNVCGLLAFEVGYDDVTEVSLSGAVVYDVVVPTRAAAIVPIPGGTLTVVLEDGEPVLDDFSKGLNEIVLKAPSGGVFSQKETYYMAVPPCTLSVGVTFTLTRQSGDPVEITMSGSKSVERSKIHDVGLLQAGEPVDPDPDEPEVPEGNRISYDGGKTWHPLKSAGVYRSQYSTGLDFIFLGTELSSISFISTEPLCDWFAFDIDENLLGDYELPVNLDTNWYCYFDWKGSADSYNYEPDYADSGSISISAPSDFGSVDFELDAVYGDEHIVVVYSGPVLQSEEYIWDFNNWEDYDIEPASEEDVAGKIAGEYYLEGISAMYKDYYSSDLLTITETDGFLGNVRVSGTIMDVPVDFEAVFATQKGKDVLVIGNGIWVGTGPIAWYGSGDEDIESWLYLITNDGYLGPDLIIIEVSGDHQLSIDLEGLYLALYDNTNDDYLDVASSVYFEYLGPSYSPAPAPKLFSKASQNVREAPSSGKMLWNGPIQKRAVTGQRIRK